MSMTGGRSLLRRLWDGRDVAIVYAAIVLVVGLVIALLPSGEMAEVVEKCSTNLANMRRRPLTVLVASAFVVSPAWTLVILVPLVWAYGEVQRWVGRASAIIVGVIGHVGATLFVATMELTELTKDRAGFRIVHDTDVGVSYGLAAVAGLLVGRFAPLARRRYVVLCVLVLAGQLVVVQGFTALGHITAWFLGVGITVPVDRAIRAADAAHGRRGSGVLREAQVEPAMAGIEPAGGDHLGAGEEVDALRTVRVGVPEQ
jgi:hypothetical protein